MYIDEKFAINGIRPNFLSLLLTGIIHIGVTGTVVSKIVGSGACSLKDVHNIILRIYRAYAESTHL